MVCFSNNNTTSVCVEHFLSTALCVTMRILFVYQSRDATRSLASSSTSNKPRKQFTSSAAPGTGSSTVASGSKAVIASLRGKIHSLERTLREKESAMAAMKREVRTTQLKEMEMQCEVYYREINRCAMAVMEGDGCTTLAFDIYCTVIHVQTCVYSVKCLNLYLFLDWHRVGSYRFWDWGLEAKHF